MKIVVSAKGNGLDSLVDPRFGRCPCFAFYKEEDKQWSFLPNPGAAESTGAGVRAAQFALEQNVDILLTGEVGPKAMQVLSPAGVKIYSVPEITVAEALERYNQGLLSTGKPKESVGKSRSSSDNYPQQSNVTPRAKERLAVATDGPHVAQHFGRCSSYTLVDIEDGQIGSKNVIANPGHEPGFLPRFLGEKGVQCVIAGGMGPRAQNLFAEQNIRTITGVTGFVEDAVECYLAGRLKSGESLCDHGQGGHECHGH